ncbi:MAG: hypothetical protein ACK40G_14030 [Cytophagaceae bacterium]
MLLLEITFSVLLALVFTGLATIFSGKRLMKKFWAFFLLIFFMILAAVEWTSPVGSLNWGNYWVPAIIAGIIGTLFILIYITRIPDETEKDKSGKRIPKSFSGPVYNTDESTSGIYTGATFWILLLILSIFSIAGVILR